MDLEESARLAGGHHWIESRMFEILGGWVQPTEDNRAKLLFDRHSQHHAWRAGQWWERLPVLAGVDRAALATPPCPEASEAAERLVALDGAVERLACTYRVVLPRLVSRYQRHRSVADAQSDGATLRTLDMVVSDVVADWREGEVLLQELLDHRSKVDAAAKASADIEILLVPR